MTTTSPIVINSQCQRCHGSGWVVADMDSDGNGHWAECGCRPDPATGLIQCAPFCQHQDGHPSPFRADQWCQGVPMTIELPLWRLAANDQYDPYGLYPDHLAVMPARHWEAGEDVEYVRIHHAGPDEEMVLTPAQARELAVNLLLAIGAIEGQR